MSCVKNYINKCIITLNDLFGFTRTVRQMTLSVVVRVYSTVKYLYPIGWSISILKAEPIVVSIHKMERQQREEKSILLRLIKLT